MQPSIPSYISDNLRFDLRPYQVQAIQSWLNRANNLDNSSQKYLFQMATGSGKTLIMAALILDLFYHGHRNFIFFVSSTNILEKTRDNFLHSYSPKYLFAQNLNVNGQKVHIREVETFASSDADAINIIFTTTQRLHQDLTHPHENRPTKDDLSKYEFVLIGDEAHHNNIKTFHEDIRSWEETVEKLSNINPNVILLEFTATMDFQNQQIYDKYRDRLLFRYDLRNFRSEKYSKDVLVYATDGEVLDRILRAVIISEYRRAIAQKYQIKLKPVVLFKSRTVVENKNNFRKFIALMAELKVDRISALKTSPTNILKQAFQFFAAENISETTLCQKIQQSFHPDYCLRIDGSQKLSSHTQFLINTLETEDNPYRAIFAVDMLKEGWDVLNLFDIVRLYETRAERLDITKKTTISEAQLIGRGARYCPFTFQNFPKARRKFDDQDHELRVLEQLHYHTSHDVEYASEIKQALYQTGITDFTHSSILVDQSSQVIAEPSANIFQEKTKLNVPSVFYLYDFEPLANRTSEEEASNAYTLEIGLDKDISLNVIYAAMNRDYRFNTKNLQKNGFSGRSSFVQQLSKSKIIIKTSHEVLELSQAQKLHILQRALAQIHGETI